MKLSTLIDLYRVVAQNYYETFCTARSCSPKKIKDRPQNYGENDVMVASCEGDSQLMSARNLYLL